MYQEYYTKHQDAVEQAIQEYIEAPDYLLHQIFKDLRNNHLCYLVHDHQEYYRVLKSILHFAAHLLVPYREENSQQIERVLKLLGLLLKFLKQGTNSLHFHSLVALLLKDTLRKMDSHLPRGNKSGGMWEVIALINVILKEAVYLEEQYLEKLQQVCVVNLEADSNNKLVLLQVLLLSHKLFMIAKLPALKQAVETAQESFQSSKFTTMCLKILPIYSQEDVHTLFAQLDEKRSQNIETAVFEKVKRLIVETKQRELIKMEIFSQIEQKDSGIISLNRAKLKLFESTLIKLCKEQSKPIGQRAITQENYEKWMAMILKNKHIVPSRRDAQVFGSQSETLRQIIGSFLKNSTPEQVIRMAQSFINHQAMLNQFARLTYNMLSDQQFLEFILTNLLLPVKIFCQSLRAQIHQAEFQSLELLGSPGEAIQFRLQDISPKKQAYQDQIDDEANSVILSTQSELSGQDFQKIQSLKKLKSSCQSELVLLSQFCKIMAKDKKYVKYFRDVQCFSPRQYFMLIQEGFRRENPRLIKYAAYLILLVQMEPGQLYTLTQNIASLFHTDSLQAQIKRDFKEEKREQKIMSSFQDVFKALHMRKSKYYEWPLIFKCIDEDTEQIMKYKDKDCDMEKIAVKINKGLHIFKAHLEIDDSDWEETVSQIQKILMLPALVISTFPQKRIEAKWLDVIIRDNLMLALKCAQMLAQNLHRSILSDPYFIQLMQMLAYTVESTRFNQSQIMIIGKLFLSAVLRDEVDFELQKPLLLFLGVQLNQEKYPKKLYQEACKMMTQNLGEVVNEEGSISTSVVILLFQLVLNIQAHSYGYFLALAGQISGFKDQKMIQFLAMIICQLSFQGCYFNEIQQNHSFFRIYHLTSNSNSRKTWYKDISRMIQQTGGKQQLIYFSYTLIANVLCQKVQKQGKTKENEERRLIVFMQIVQEFPLCLEQNDVLLLLGLLSEIETGYSSQIKKHLAQDLQECKELLVQKIRSKKQFVNYKRAHLTHKLGSQLKNEHIANSKKYEEIKEALIENRECAIEVLRQIQKEREARRADTGQSVEQRRGARQ